ALTGAPDNTFGTAGAVSNGLRGAWCQPQGLIATPTAIYVTGFEQEPTTTGRRDWRYEKRSAVDGSLVAGYGLDSHIVVPAHYSSVVTLAIAGDALIAAGIDHYSAPDSRWRVEKRFLSNGQLDPDFGNQGEVLSDPSTKSDAVKAMTI